MNTPMKQQISAGQTPFFYDQKEAFRYLRGRRWTNGYYCPRCASKNVREVRTERILEAFSCNECRYNYTTLSDSFFHGSRIPTYVMLQLIAAFDFVGIALPRPPLGKMLGIKQTNVAKYLHKLNKFPHIRFATADGSYVPIAKFCSVIEFLEQPGVAILTDRLSERVDQLLSPEGRPLRRQTRLSKTSE